MGRKNKNSFGRKGIEGFLLPCLFTWSDMRWNVIPSKVPRGKATFRGDKLYVYGIVWTKPDS